MRGSSSQRQTAHNRPHQQKQLYGHYRPRTTQATQPKEDNMRTYKSRSRIKLIEEANKGSLTHLIKDKTLTIEQKRELIAERNPFIYALGIGGISASNKAVSKTE
jgi:uncharacterized protein Smg (DUF494 family)